MCGCVMCDHVLMWIWQAAPYLKEQMEALDDEYDDEDDDEDDSMTGMA